MHWNVLLRFFVLTFLLAGKSAKCQGEDFRYLDIGLMLYCWWKKKRMWVMYLLTPCCRVLLEKLTVNFAATQEIPRIYGNRKYLTVPTSGRHLSLSWDNSIRSPRPPPTSWRSILILSSYLRLGLPNGLFPSGFLTNTLCECGLYAVLKSRRRNGIGVNYKFWKNLSVPSTRVTKSTKHL
jgi:hypothetical protein